MRKTLALFLAVLTVFLCFAVCAQAGAPETDEAVIADVAAQGGDIPYDPDNPDNPNDPENPTDPENPENPTDPEEPTEPEKTDDPNRYAEMYLISYWNVASPHVFIYFENLTEHDITVGAYTCPKGGAVSVATLGISVADGDGAGIYYNMELYRIGKTGTFPLVVSLHKTVSKADLEKVTKFILNNNHWDFFIFNCGWFAAKCWNTGGGSYLVPITVFPSILRLEMLLHLSQGKVPLKKAERNQVMRQLGEGSNARLKVASEKSMS